MQGALVVLDGCPGSPGAHTGLGLRKPRDRMGAEGMGQQPVKGDFVHNQKERAE